MTFTFLQSRFLKDNSYLLLTTLLLFSISVFTKQKNTKSSIEASYSKEIQNYINKGENKFNIFLSDIIFINSINNLKQEESELALFNNESQFFYVYKNLDNLELVYWNTQTVLPDTNFVVGVEDKKMLLLPNGYYFAQKKRIGFNTIVSLLPIKWNYVVSNDYLKNDFLVNPIRGKNFEINIDKKNATYVKTGENLFLFSLKVKSNYNLYDNNKITAWLRIFAFFPFLIFIHFAAENFKKKRGLSHAFFFLLTSLIIVRLVSYFFADIIGMRQFELFNPAVYGSNIILRSLGDFLINVLLLLWVIIFLKNNLVENYKSKFIVGRVNKWILLSLSALAILFYTFIAGSVVRSLVTDSQISFDVINFFSLNIFTIIGFLILSCIALGYYYFFRIVFFYLKNAFPSFFIPLMLIITVVGLLILSFRIGSFAGAFELYELMWLIVFLLLIKSDLLGVFTSKPIVSKMVFWLFFFSLSITFILIAENEKKELINRAHYAEVIATKNDPFNDFVLNSVLTDFREELIAPKFYLFENDKTAYQIRDSLIKNNFSTYSDNYNTKILVYDNAEKALYNDDPISYNSINSILKAQGKPTSVSGMFFYDTGFDSYNFISKKIIKREDGSMLGYIFIVINSKKFANENLYPELFSRGQSNSIENSNKYAYAIYKNGKLLTSLNDYPFSTNYNEKPFGGSSFFLENKKNYSLLWYHASSNKNLVIVKKNNSLLQIITLFSYLFCAFIILNSISSFVALLLLTTFKYRKIKKALELTIRAQVHSTIIFFSVISFLIIAVATILFFISTAETNNKEKLSRTISVMRKDLLSVANYDMIQQANFTADEDLENTALQKIIKRIAEVHGSEVNLYSPSGDLKASSLALPYSKGIVSKKMNPTAYFHLSKLNEIQFYQNESIGKLTFVSNYLPVLDSSGKDMAYLNIPYFTSQNKLKEEISNFLVTVIIINAFILLISGIVALMITNRITNSFSIISEKMKLLNLSKRNEVIVWERNDEIGDLVKEYNKMVEKLDKSVAALAKTERENAWQEMAKQVAHEIKNPLTPMKLSMQFLHRAIEDNSPNIKELSKKVSNTLVEQIDHLSSIAEEFSRFANIENAKPEIFNVNEVLRSVKELNETNNEVNFSWKIIPYEVFVNADKTHINRILTNLILNGIQAVPESVMPEIQIEETADNGLIQIKITDNGSGINDEVKAKIFTPNFTTKTSGTGLGLAMCIRMAEQAGGNLTFETNANGTSFFLKLPIHNLIL